jgi:DNA replication protein DnaC
MAESNMQAPEQQLADFISQQAVTLGDPMKQNCGCLGTYVLLSEGRDGFVKAEPCLCIEALTPTNPYQRTYHDGFGNYDQDGIDLSEYENQLQFFNALKKNHQAITDAKIPNLYKNSLNENFYTAEVSKARDELISEAVTNKFHFFYGNTGTGKTQSAIYLLMSYLRAHPQRSAFYIPTHILLEKKRLTSAYSFEAKSLKDGAEFSYRNAIKKVKDIDFLVLDELGQTKLTDMESKVVFDLLDHRYAANKVTILISNHCDNKRLSLDGKKLSTLVGARISSRLKSAKQVHFSGPDYRAQAKPEMISEEEAENFNMGEASPKLMTLDENTHHIMNWLTRNPAFETVDTKKRKALTEIVAGNERDKNRESPCVYTDVWVKGDQLIVDGPICDQEDMKLYAFLVKELTQSHKEGNTGLVLKISIKAILRLLRQNECGENIRRVKRQLNRLRRMSLDFKNTKGREWQGPLLTEFTFEEEGRNKHLEIAFSHFMIAYYKAAEYTMLDKNIFWTLSGDSATLFAFYTSHSFEVPPLPIEKLQKILAIPETISKKAVVRRITTAYKKLVTAGVFDPQKTKFEKNYLHVASSQ